MAENRFKKYADQAPQVFYQDPSAVRGEQREDERLDLSREAAARAAQNDALARQEKADKLAREREEAARLERAQASGISDSLAQMRNTIDAARAAQQMGAGGDGIGPWEGSEGFRQSAPLSILGLNSDSLNMEALLETVGSNTAFDRLQKMREQSPTGGALGAVSEIELKLLKSSIASLSQRQSPEQFERNLQKVIDSYTRVAGKLSAADQYYRETGSMDGFTPPTDEELAGFSFDAPTPPSPPADRTLAGQGATTTTYELPQEYQDRHAAYLRQNWGNITPDGYAQFRAGLDNEFSDVASPDLEAYRAIAPAFNQAAEEGQPPEAVGSVPPATRELSGLEQGVNDFVTSPFGTATTSAINSATFGVPDALAGRRLQAAQELNPKAAFAGDLVGGTVGSVLGGAGATIVGAGRFAPLVGDALYGTTFGALSDDDPVTGALIGGAGALVGDQVGKYGGRAIARMRSPDDPLSEGGRAIVETVSDQDEVIDALTRAQTLGVPMTLADASPELQSLAGSAVRFSPTTAGQARQTMAMRNEGQLDRLAEAVERDLGPVSNIPQRSADLMQEARAKAGPLYDEAFAGGSVAPLEDQFQNAFAASGSDVASAKKALNDAANSMTQSRARVSRSGDNVYANAQALPADRAAVEEYQKSQRKLTEAESVHAQNLERLRRAQEDGSANAPGAIWTPRIQNFLDDPIAQSGLRKGLEVQRLEALAEGSRFDPTELAITGMDDVGNPVVASVPNMRTLDALKRGLDELIDEYPKDMAGRPQLDQRGRAIDQVRRSFIKEVDASNPAYAPARAAYAGPAQERDFLRRGSSAITARPDELSVELAGLTPEQRQQMQLGFQSEIMGRAGNLRNNSNPWAQINTPNAEGRMGALYEGTEDADIARLLDQRDLELQLAGSANRLIGNSATAEREIADEFFKQRTGMGADVGMGIIETGALGGPWMTVGKSVADRMFKDRREQAAAAANRALADDMGPLLLSDGPQGGIDALTGMAAQDADYQAIVEALLESGDRYGRQAGTAASGALANRYGY